MSGSGGFLPLAMVATLIPSKKVESMVVNGVTGRQAINKEWENLRSRGCWDETRMRKLVDVIREAEQERRTIHIGSMLELLYLKHSELAEEFQKLKGRVVFLGDRVKDQYGAAAVFEQLSSSPAGIEASRFIDAYGMMQTDDGVNHIIQQADAEQAYTGVPREPQRDMDTSPSTSSATLDG